MKKKFSTYKILMWKLIEASTYVVQEIDGKSVTLRAARSNNSWFRKHLRRECDKLYGKPVPDWLFKSEYAKILVVLRGLRRLEYLVQKKMYGILSENCPICKEHIIPPFFGHRGVGYHLECILSWINVSHKFTDPITGREYTDKELHRIDTVAREYKVDSNVHELKYDVHRIAEDEDIREHEERAEILCELLDRDMMTLTEIPADGMVYGMIRSHFLRLFQQLTYTDMETARTKVSEFIESNLGSREHINRLLFEVFESIDEWDAEWEAYDSDDPEHEPMPSLEAVVGGPSLIPSHMSPILNMIFNDLFQNNIPAHGGSITIQVPDSPLQGALEIVRLPSVPR